MAIPRFYAGSEELQPGLVQLPEAESRHAGRSRRLTVGDAVMLFDGREEHAQSGHLLFGATVLYKLARLTGA